MSWKQVGLLSAVIALGSVPVLGSLSTAPVLAATGTETAKIYNQFQQYVQKPSTLAQARNYLINHIDEVDTWTATRMTLQLENALKAHLAVYSEKVFPDNVQKAMNSAFTQNKSLTYTSLLNTIKDSKIRSVLMEGRDKGYKMETSEGMYYPVMHYEGFKIFKPYITKDIAAYIDIMATESNHPSIFDGAVMISWTELMNRALALEEFVTKYPSSNRTAVIQKELLVATSLLLHGSNNTPAYDYDALVIEPELRQAYGDAIKNGPGNSRILAILEKLLSMLDTTNNRLTPDIEKFIKESLNS